MGKSSPEKYNPGELDRTRHNLGELSREEADRMAEILGGEIGIEKTDEALQQKYDRLRSTASPRSREKTAGAGNRPSGSADKAAAKQNGTSAYTGHYIRKKSSVQKIKYLDRIRIDRIAAKPEHRIKTKAAVVSTYLSFLVKTRDTVNPEFIIEGERFYYSHIELLVCSLKSMLKLIKPSIFKNYINPFYREIIKNLISWDLAEMSNSLSLLQKSPRNRSFKDCGDLCRMIYLPIFKITDTELKYVYAAADRLYRVLLLLHQDDAEELIRIKNLYLDIKEKIKIVFKDVAYTCYPLLLKLTGNRFFYYREFIRKNRVGILDFLSLNEKDLIVQPEDIQSLGKKQYSLNHLKKQLEKEKQALLDSLKAKETDRNESEIRKSTEFLEQLFPESQWIRYREFPDYFPYFHPLFKFPKGTELIAFEDPLQQIIVLAAIIQDLLYGFRSIRIAADENEIIESTINRWHLFIDEMIQNSYLKLLVEYCRNIEKGTEYSTNKFGQKLLTDIYWFKRKFILPRLKFKILYKSESIPLKAPKFYELVHNFYSALTGLMEKFDYSSSRQSIIENYDSPYHLEIKNITSFRLGKVLEKDKVAPTNENLIRHTMMIVSLLDFLLNSCESPYYSGLTEEIPVYRYDPVFQGKPQYSVPLIDTGALLKKY